MKQTLTLTLAGLLLAAFCATVPADAPHRRDRDMNFPPLRELVIPDIQETRLANGTPLYLLPDHELPLVSVFVLIDTGGLHNPADKIGLAEISLGLMRSGGIPGKTGDELDQLLDRLGASVSSASGAGTATLSASCLSRDLDTVLEIVTAILREPAFAQNKLDLLKTQMRSAVSRRNDQPEGIAGREFNRLVYGPDSPHGAQMEYAHLQAIEREDVVAFHRRFFGPNTVRIGLRGSFDPAAAQATLNRLTADWAPVPTPPPLPKVQGPDGPSVHLAVRTDVNQSYIRLGHLGIRVDDPDYHAVEVMNSILGTSGFLSRLMQVVRTEMGLTYGISGGVGSELAYPGVTRIGTSTKLESTGVAIDAILNEVRRIRDEPVRDEELAIAKEAYLNSYVFQYESPTSVLRRKMVLAHHGYPADFMETFQQRVSEVTVADVQRVAQKHLHPDRMVLLVVGKPDQFDKPLDTYGPVQMVDLTIPEPPVPVEAEPEATPAVLAEGRRLLDTMADRIGAGPDITGLTGFRMAQDVKISPMPGMSIAAQMEMIAFPPDRMHMQMSSEQFPMLNMTMAIKDGLGWVKNMQGYQEFGEEQTRQQLEGFEHNLLLLMRDLRADRLEALPLGPRTVQEHEWLAVRVRQDGRKPLTLYFDPATGDLAGMAYRGNHQGEPGEFLVTYEAFQALGGLNFPSQSVTYFNGNQFMSSVTTQLELNPVEDPALYESPAR